MMQKSLSTGPRALIRELRDLLARRAAEEKAIESAWREESGILQRELDEETARIEKSHQRRVERAEAACREAKEKAEAEFSADDESVREAYEEDRGALEEKADDNEAKAQKKMDEAVWLSETVYEAAIDQPRELFEQTCRDYEALVNDGEVLRREFEEALRKSWVFGLTPPTLDVKRADAAPPADRPARITMEEAAQQARNQLDALQSLRLLYLLRGPRPLMFLLVGAGLGAASAFVAREVAQTEFISVGLGALAGAGLILALLIAANVSLRINARSLWRSCAEAISIVAAAHEPAIREAEEDRTRRERELRDARDRDVARAKERYGSIIDQIRERRASRLSRADEKYPRRLKEIRQRRDDKLAEAENLRNGTVQAADAERDEKLTALRSRLEPQLASLREKHDQAWSELTAMWNSTLADLESTRDAILDADRRWFPRWDDGSWNDWQPPHDFAPAIRFGQVQVDLNDLPGGLPDDERLARPRESTFALPATLYFPDRCSVLVESDADDDGASLRVIQNVMLRLLTCVPPSKARFTIIDPVGLGQNFAGFMHLADYNDALVGGKIWTEPRHIEQRLADLTEHMEKVIQKYLRNEFESIDQYNQQAGEIAEPYRFLVIADFPSNFTDAAMRRLGSIITSGPRCGVYTLIVRDRRHKVPEGFDIDELKRNSVTLVREGGRFVWDSDTFRDLPLTVDEPPAESFITRIMNRVGEEAVDAGRVEVPFDVVAPGDAEAWSGTTETELRVALGKSGATKLQHLVLGRGTAQHALIAGKTGSGKSTLMHALVTNLALWYSPDEIEMYLVDFKKGVEFKTYAIHRVPHIRAIAIESDREFGVSVLQRLDEELHRRGELFRQLGVQDLAAFRRARPEERMPRTLLIVDEFQELFVEDDKLAQDAAMLLDRLVRQGRAFGIHVLLGSQTLGGAYTLARSTIGQMAVRIALQCSESDSYLILSEDNAAARLLSRPGEAIYNDANGMVEGNSPFQVVWLPDHRREQHLKRVEALTAKSGKVLPPPIVFEGNIPAQVTANQPLERLLDASGFSEPGPETRCWLGEAIAIKDPTAAAFRRHSGHNLLMVGQRDDAALAISAIAMISIAAQHPDAQFHFLDGSPADSEYAPAIEALLNALPHEIQYVRPREAPEAIAEIAALLERRQADDAHHAPPVFLFIYGLQRFRDLRHSDDFSFSMSDEDAPPRADKLFSDVLRDGPGAGVHTIAWCDTVNNVNRTLERQALREFELRVLFQMSPGDSSLMIDSPQAAKLGFHRGLFYSEEEGRLEKFRPYAMPEKPWLERAGRVLRQRLEAADKAE